MPVLLPPKPYMPMPDLVQLVQSRGMHVDDAARAERKLAQVGYYRLSGFWFPCRQYLIGDNGQIAVSAQTGKPVWAETMLAGTSFNKLFELYLFDKRLRLLMLDALERVEVLFVLLWQTSWVTTTPWPTRKPVLFALSKHAITPINKAIAATHGPIF